MNGWSKAAFAVLLGLGSSCADRSRAVDVSGVHALPVSSSATTEAPPPPTDTNLGVDGPFVLVTIDGVRWQEVFEGTDPKLGPHHSESGAQIFPNLYQLGLVRGAFLGAPGHGVIRATGPEYVSLPGYNEILGGRSPSHCPNNDCPRTPRLTLLDEAHRRGATVAAFASWGRIDLALTPHPGTFFASCGRGEPKSEALIGDEESRPDRLTASAALAYYEAERPDVFYLGLGDPDEYAHLGDYRGYVAALHFADEVLGRLLGILDRDARGRRTHIVVTPDHGRSKDFRSHGGYAPEAARVWTVAAGPRFLARGMVASPVPRRLADIAPTMRLVLGLQADESREAGTPALELFDGASEPNSALGALSVR